MKTSYDWGYQFNPECPKDSYVVYKMFNGKKSIVAGNLPINLAKDLASDPESCEVLIKHFKYTAIGIVIFLISFVVYILSTFTLPI